MRRRLRDGIGIAVLSAAALGIAVRAHGAAVDANGDITLGVRAYTAARVGTENTDETIRFQQGDPQCPAGSGLICQSYRSLTFPVSPAGHLRQSRYFVEAELRHKLDRLIREGFGPFSLLNDLPFKMRNVGYTLVYRGEYDGVYDYGPAEYRTAYQFYNPVLVPPFGNKPADVGLYRKKLRNASVDRQRLFQAFVEADMGRLFIRFGRQILAWGETDVFRLLDNINPIDNSFGGFLVPLDERRVPLDMLRASFAIPTIPHVPFYEMFLEGFGAFDNATAIKPGIQVGSPWQLPNLVPSATLLTLKDNPPATFQHMRGGLQFKFNTPMPWIDEAQFGLAHYYTYLDIPAVQTYVAGPPLAFPFPIMTGSANGFLAQAVQSVPTTQITGASTNFSVPAGAARLLGLSGEPIVRSEFAYFHNEARFTQSQLDPFVYGLNGCSGGTVLPNGLCTGGRRTGDSLNYVIGMDLNQFIRPLNHNQSFFISTQFFYKHLRHPAARVPLEPPPGGFYLPGQPHTFDGEVLPVPAYNISPENRNVQFNTAVESVFVHNPIDQYLQTLLIATSYYSGQVAPAMAFLYDWSGAFVMQPQVTLSRDPFRFTMGYSFLTAGTLKGASGISLLRDRDNVLFQFEYVL
jgi:hypothetical protein